MMLYIMQTGDGEPVLLLHGYPQSSSCWRHQIPVLAQHHRVIAPDWPGFGRSEPPLGCFDTTLEDEYLGWMDTPQGRRVYIDFFANYHVEAVPGLADSLGKIACPTAVIWGDRDPYIPFQTARELAERIPSATLTRLRGGDHYIMEERPEAITEALLQLLARPRVIRGEVGTPRT